MNSLIKKSNLISICALLSIFSMFMLSGCANPISPNTYDVCDANIPSKVEHGVIVGKRPVKIDGNTRTGGLAGATAGAIGGSAIGGCDRANIAGGIGGAIIGGIIGNAIEKSANTYPAYEYIIKLKKGTTISIAQATELEFCVNQPVLVIYGPVTRIVPDDTIRSRNSRV